VADLGELLNDELATFLATPQSREVTGTIDELAHLFGTTPRQQNPRMAAVIAGTGDKSTAEYKAAIRSVQRYRAGEGRQRRSPTLLRLRVIQALVRVRRLGAIITGIVRVSSDQRRRRVEGVLSPRDTRRVIERHEAGDVDGATDAFVSGFTRAYSGVRLDFIDVESVALYEGGEGE
jgi:hypothetical protein